MKKGLFLSTSLFCLIAAAAMAAEAPKSAAAGKAPGAAAVSKETSSAKTTAPIASTVEEVYTKRAELDQKRVTLHGTAVKVTSGIMGKTWTHIQDGTGDKTKGTNDIICISAEAGARVGDTVNVVGTLKVNPDTNSRYKVMIEDAVFKN